MFLGGGEAGVKTAGPAVFTVLSPSGMVLKERKVKRGKGEKLKKKENHAIGEVRIIAFLCVYREASPVWLI